MTLLWITVHVLRSLLITPSCPCKYLCGSDIYDVRLEMNTMKVLVKRKRRRIASGDATRERACAVPGHSIRTIRCPAPGISCTRQRQLISISYRFKPPCTMCMSGVCALGICSMFELPRRNLRPPLRADCLYLLRTYLLHSWPTRYATLDAQRSALKAPFSARSPYPVPCPLSCALSALPLVLHPRLPASPA